MYLLEKYKKMDGDVVYTIYDENTESSITLPEERLVEALRQGIIIKNIRLNNGRLEIKKWFSSIERDAETAGVYVLVSIAKKHDVYTIVDHLGNIRYIHENELLTNLLTEMDKINFRLEDGKLDYIDVTEINTDEEFKARIDNMYELYIAKSRLLGLGCEFSYAIDNTDVIIVKYTGESKKIVLPNFVTSINREAFESKDMISITLNSGLKYIGENAFKGCRLEQIILPESVEYVWGTAFIGNKGLIKDKIVNRDRVKFSSDKTVVI